MAMDIESILNQAILFGYWLIAIFALIGALLAATTREDAFTVAERQGKLAWVGLLLLSALAIAIAMPFLSWIGIVITGLYWFDVRPQINDILSGNYGW